MPRGGVYTDIFKALHHAATLGLRQTSTSIRAWNIFDKAALEYAEQLEGQATLVPVVSRVSMVAGRSHPQNMGWALKSSGSRRPRFTPAQKSYLTAKFRLGEQTGKRTDAAPVARAMMCAKNSNGSRLFTSEDYLTTNQIAGFFSRLASKKSLAED